MFLLSSLISSYTIADWFTYLSPIGGKSAHNWAVEHKPASESHIMVFLLSLLAFISQTYLRFNFIMKFCLNLNEVAHILYHTL